MNITTERLDKFPLLLEIMVRLGLPGIIDNHLRRHGMHQELSWGWIATILLAHILTQGIDNPTTERLLKMFDDITLTMARLPGQTIRHLPALTSVQIRILELLGLSADVYIRLAYNSE